MALVGLVAAAAMGCGSAEGGPSATPETLTADEVSADQAVVSVSYTGRNGTADEVPALAVYADGLMLRFDEDAPFGYLEGRLADGGLDRILAAAAEEQLLDDPEYGDPQITDVGSTDVEVRTDQGHQEHSAFALGHDEGVGGSEAQARERLSTFLQVVEDDTELGSDATPYAPASVDVQLRGVWPDPDETSAPAAVPWPLPGPLTGLQPDLDGGAACLTLTKAQAARFLPTLAADNDADRIWAKRDRDPVTPDLYQAEFRAVLPGATTCAEQPPPDGPEVEQTWTSPFPQGTASPLRPFEAGAAADAVLRTVAGKLPDRGFDSSDLSWFVKEYAGVVVDGQRYVDVHVTCGAGSEDEGLPCEWFARYDVSTGRLTDFVWE